MLNQVLLRLFRAGAAGGMCEKIVSTLFLGKEKYFEEKKGMIISGMRYLWFQVPHTFVRAFHKIEKYSKQLILTFVISLSNFSSLLCVQWFLKGCQTPQPKSEKAKNETTTTTTTTNENLSHILLLLYKYILQQLSAAFRCVVPQLVQCVHLSFKVK